MVRNLLLAFALVAGVSAWLASDAARAADPMFCGKYVSTP
jgi:hypothetical protein